METRIVEIVIQVSVPAWWTAKQEEEMKQEAIRRVTDMVEGD